MNLELIVKNIKKFWGYLSIILKRLLWKKDQEEEKVKLKSEEYVFIIYS